MQLFLFSDWTKFGDTSIKLFPINGEMSATYFEATQLCEEFSSSVVLPRGLAEHNAMVSLLKQLKGKEQTAQTVTYLDNPLNTNYLVRKKAAFLVQREKMMLWEYQ